MQKIITQIIFLVFVSQTALPQLGGTKAYSFLNVPNSARVASLGGKIASSNESDLNFSFHNPALLNESLDKHLILNYVNFYSGINFGYLGYAKALDEKSSVSAGIHYVNYGTFENYNEIGQKYGEFNAADYALNLIYSYKIDSNFRAGLNIKPLYSKIEHYHSFALAADMSLLYTSGSKLFSASLILKNLGSQIKPYTSGNYEPLPFEVMLGISRKLKYAPFRVYLTAHNLQRYKLSGKNIMEEENNVIVFFDEEEEESGEKGFTRFRRKAEDALEQSLRHAIIGVEFAPSQNFYFSVGYNYLRRKELSISSKPGLTGFSWGFGMNIKKYQISFARATYHLSGASNHFSISTDLSRFYKRL